MVGRGTAEDRIAEVGGRSPWGPSIRFKVFLEGWERSGGGGRSGGLIEWVHRCDAVLADGVA